MAYFPNGTSGEVFADQCDKCRYGQKPCPIACVQLNYNYEAANNKTASGILNDLVKNDGTCEMYRTFEKDFKLTEGEKTQLNLFCRGKNEE